MGRWWETLLNAMLRPGRFFAGVRGAGRLDRAILFFLIGVLAESIVAPMTTGWVETSVAEQVMKRFLPSTSLNGLDLGDDFDLGRLLPTGKPPGSSGHAAHDLPGISRQDPISAILPQLRWILSVVSCASSIIFGFVSLFASAALFQAGAWIFIPRRHSFGETLRTVAYAHAPLVWTVVPVVGDIVFMIWLSVLIVIGLRVVHETTKARVVAALSFWPTLILLTFGLGCALIVRQLLSAMNG